MKNLRIHMNWVWSVFFNLMYSFNVFFWNKTKQQSCSFSSSAHLIVVHLMVVIFKNFFSTINLLSIGKAEGETFWWFYCLHWINWMKNIEKCIWWFLDVFSKQAAIIEDYGKFSICVILINANKINQMRKKYYMNLKYSEAQWYNFLWLANHIYVQVHILVLLQPHEYTLLYHNSFSQFWNHVRVYSLSNMGSTKKGTTS